MDDAYSERAQLDESSDENPPAPALQLEVAIDGGKEPKKARRQSAVMRQVSSLADLYRKKDAKGQLLLDPRKPAMRTWSIIIICCYLWLALVTPYEISLMPIPSNPPTAIYVISRLIDVLLIAEMVVHFYLMYEKSLQGVGTVWIASPRKVRQHYLHGWFTLDLLTSCFLMLVDTLPLTKGADEWSHFDRNVFRALRLARLLLRLLHPISKLNLNSTLNKWRQHFHVSYAYTAIAMCLIKYMLVGHLFACLLNFQSEFADSKATTWLTTYGYCRPDPPHERTPSIDLPSDAAVTCVSESERYTASLYWSIMLISGAAGGEVAFGRFRQSEQLLFMFLVICGALLWSDIIGTFCAVLANWAPEENAFNQRLDDLERFCSMNRIHPAMRKQLRKYFHRSKHQQIAKAGQALVDLMSPMLQGQVSILVNGWLERLPFMKGVEPAFKVEISMHLVASVLAPKELAPGGRLYYIQRGVVLYSSKVLVSGSSWGADLILERPQLRRWSGRAVTYVEVFSIGREELLRIADKYPRAESKVRWSAVRLALIRTLHDQAAKEAAEELKACGGKMKRTFTTVLLEASELSPEQIEEEHEAMPFFAGSDAGGAGGAPNAIAAEVAAEVRKVLRVHEDRIASMTAQQISKVSAELASVRNGLAELSSRSGSCCCSSYTASPSETPPVSRAASVAAAGGPLPAAASVAAAGGPLPAGASVAAAVRSGRRHQRRQAGSHSGGSLKAVAAANAFARLPSSSLRPAGEPAAAEPAPPEAEAEGPRADSPSILHI